MKSESIGVVARDKWRSKWAFRSFLWSMALFACIEGVRGVFRHYEIPTALRIPLALLPLLPLAVLVRRHWQLLAQEDELARHIARDAFVVAFFASLGVFICAELLRDGGVLPAFAWTSKTLFYVMIGTLALGHSWSAWRYR